MFNLNIDPLLLLKNLFFKRTTPLLMKKNAEEFVLSRDRNLFVLGIVKSFLVNEYLP